MSDREQFDSKVRSWLAAEAPERAPDRLRERVEGGLDQVQQGRMWPRALLDPYPGRPRAVVLAAALLVIGALVVAALGALGVGTRAPSPAPPTSTPAATPHATPQPTPRPTPPGDLLPAGTNASQRLITLLTFDVPVGWTRVDDIDVMLTLAPPEAGLTTQPNGGGNVFDNVGIYVDPAAGAADGSNAIDQSAGSDAGALSTWLASRPQLMASKPVATTVGGLSGFSLDIQVGPGAGGLCGIKCVNLFNMAGGVQFGILEHEVDRVILVDRPGGGTLLIVIEDADGVDVAGLRDQAQPVVDSLRVVRSTP